MLVTDTTRKALAYRRQKRDMTRRGYEQITCAFGVGQLWELDRGGRWHWRIVDAVVGVDGKTIYAKAEPRP